MDVCPVGAITTRDYRFKSRPWDNPSAVDTICTLCEKGCNTTAWLRAKPEWAKGAQLVRITPRHNDDVNGYWMCDIGRFEYNWIESDQRLTRPLVTARAGCANTLGRRDRAAAAKALQPASRRRAEPRFLLSAHASHEEIYLTARLAQHLLGDMAQQGVAVSWTRERQAAARRASGSSVPPVDAPNVAGARAARPDRAGRGEAAPPLVGAAQRSRSGPRLGLVCRRSGPRGLDWRRRVDPGARIGQAAVPHRPDRGLHAAGGSRRRGAAGLVLGREGRELHQRAGPAAGRLAGDSAAGRSAGRQRHPAEAGGGARRRPDA